jgi:two-component system, NarL family, sensor histidine kinase UhpB
MSSLRSRLLISIFLTLALSLAAGAAFTYWHAVRKIETEMQAAIAVGGRIAHNAVDDAEEAVDPPRRLELLVADFHGDRHLQASLLVGGKVIQSSNLAEPESSAPEWFFDLFAAPSKVLHVDLPAVFDGHGTVTLRTDAHNEVAEVWGDVRLTLAVLTIFCMLVLAFFYWTLGTAIRPLENLTKAFARVGNGDYRQRVDEKGPLELMRLCQGFNRMVQRLARAETQNQRLQKQLLNVQDEERADLARDLHDEIGPLLFAVDVDTVEIERLIEERKYSGIGGRLAIIREAVAHMQKHVRGILGRLRPAVLLDVGLAHAIDNLVTFWRAHNRNLNFAVDVPEDGFGDPIDSTVYRIVQESVSNAVRHGKPGTIAIEVKAFGDDEIAVCVKDDGGGMNGTGKAGSYGILGMRERVQSLGGAFAVSDREDCRGVVVTARMPRHAGGYVKVVKGEAQGMVLQ